MTSPKRTILSALILFALLVNSALSLCWGYGFLQAYVEDGSVDTISVDVPSAPSVTKDDNIAGITLGRGYKPASDTPYISAVSPPQTLYGETTATLWASGIIAANGVKEVWAIIVRPDLDPGSPDPPITGLPAVRLTYLPKNERYEGTYDKFDVLGLYTVSIYAMDSDGMTSLPKRTTVYQKAGPDIYEDDDSYTQAKVIVLNSDTAQHHNFHDAKDGDWVKFYALAGERYIVKAFNLGEKNDVVIELYNTDGITILDSQNTIGNSHAEESLVWSCPKDGIYFVKIRHDNADVFGAFTEYDLKVFRPAAAFFGTVTGIVTDAHSLEKIADVKIRTDDNASALSLPNGNYVMTHRPGTFTVTAQKAGYGSANYPGVKVIELDITTLDLVLTPLDKDTDSDGIPDRVEEDSRCLDPNDADTDDDGIADGAEDINLNGTVDSGETDPCDIDTDADGIQDGTELGYVLSDTGPGTDIGIFQPDQDPTTTTNPLDGDTNNNGLLDGEEDKNYNGRVDAGESDPRQFNSKALPHILLLLLKD